MVPSGNTYWTELKQTGTPCANFWMDRHYLQQNKSRKRDGNSEDEYCAQKQMKPLPTYQNPRPVAMINFLVPLKDLPMENVEMGSKGNSTKTSSV
jgi:hypothetical protein